MLKFDFKHKYRPSTKSPLVFDFTTLLVFDFDKSWVGGDKDSLTFDFNNVATGEPPPPIFVAPAIRSSTALRYGVGIAINSHHALKYNPGTPLNSHTNLSWSESTPIQVDTLLQIKLRMWDIDLNVVVRYDSFETLDTQHGIKQRADFFNIDNQYAIKYDQFDTIDAQRLLMYSVPPSVDTQTKIKSNHVLLEGEARAYTLFYPPQPNIGFLTFDFDRPPLHAQGSKEVLLFDFDIDPNVISTDVEPIKIYINGILQPTGSGFSMVTGGKSDPVDKQWLLRHHALDDLVIGSGTKLRSFKDPDVPIVEPPEPPKEPIVHIPHEVYFIMNSVNITDVLTSTLIDFENFTMSRDIDSFVWSFKFQLKTEASLALVKPVGRVLKSVTININGVLIRAFIGKTATSRTVNKQSGVVTTTHSCDAWSELRKLGDPYSRKKSNTEVALTNASTLVTNELLGTGQTVEWETTNWNVPGGIHSYHNKTPIGAVLSIVNAVGGVIVPHLNDMTFKVRPRFPVSPWDWDDVGTIPDRIMSESQFFSISNESIPKDNADSVYVFGKDAGTHCVRFGKNGSAPAPDVIDKYLATSVVGQERGRNEIAKNCFLESIPMTTYVDNAGLIMPQELLEITNTSDSTVWRAMVMSTSIVCNRKGTAIIQSIIVVRFHDDD